MKELLAIIRGLLEGLDIRKRWIATFIFILLIGIFIYLIEVWTGWNYYSNLQKKVDLLSELHSLAEADIDSNSYLSPVYHELAQELSEREIPLFTFPSFRFETSQSFWKFVSGGSFWFIFAITAFFGALGDENKIVGTIILLVIGALVGLVATWIPVILSPWVNYLGVPFIQILLLLFFSSRARKRKPSNS